MSKGRLALARTVVLACTAAVGCGGQPAPPTSDDASLDAAVAHDDAGTSMPDASIGEDASQIDAASCDRDRDGFRAVACGGNDCDDDDVQTYPGNVERCGGNLSDGRPASSHDEDCNPCTVAGGGRDGDVDADGFWQLACTNHYRVPDDVIVCDAMRLAIDASAMTTSGTDCDDDPALDPAAPRVHPQQPEVCGNGLDDDCDGMVDTAVLYRDGDGDLAGDPGVMMTGPCAPGWVTNALDCDDFNRFTGPGAREMCDGVDNDCSNAVDPGGAEPAEDRDGDHHSDPLAACLDGASMGVATGVPDSPFPRDDCDDTVATTYLGAPEICGNGISDDCDSVVDNPTQRVCTDADGDAHGVGAVTTIASCTIPPGMVLEIAGCLGSARDCDDTLADVHPGAPEICNRRDDDCSSGGGATADEDADADGYVPVGATCLAAGEMGATPSAFPRGDCRDDDFDVHPGSVETCDGEDWDCSSGGGVAPDEDADDDGHAPIAAACHGFGDPLARTGAFHEDDCDDTNATSYPGAPPYTLGECTLVDHDCNSATTELTSACSAGGYCSLGATCGRGPVVRGLALGGSHGCVRLSDGSVRCWGQNFSGQLGLGATGPTQYVASVVPGLTGIVAITAGQDHVCALRSGGTVACWGENAAGQLGLGTTTDVATPTDVPGLTNVVGLSASVAHTCAWLSDGTARCWGENSYGQLGEGTTNGHLSPVAVTGLTGVVQIATAAESSCALLADGTARCWGDNASGEVGDGTNIDRLVPTRVMGLVGAVQISGSGTHTCVRLSDGTMRCWGNNAFGNLGDGTTTISRNAPVVVVGVSGVVEITAGSSVTCAAFADGSAQCWGRNTHGQLGDGTTTGRGTPAPVVGLTGVVELASGNGILTTGLFECARRNDGTVYCWGQGGRLDDGTTMQRSSPVQALALGAPVGQTAIGDDFGCVRALDGTVSCWGRNTYGQLGDGTTTTRPSPMVVPGLFGVAQVATGYTHACARMSDGTVRCWGRNNLGQLGDGTTTDHPTPTVVPGLAGVVEIDARNATTCVRLSGGTMSCWGSNGSGQFGDGTMTNRPSPTPVSGLTGVTSITVGSSHACALTTGGVPWCWGYDGAGAVGDNVGTGYRLVPTAVFGGRTFTTLVAGGGTTCATTSTGDAYCWGSNAYAAVGGACCGNRLSPLMIMSGVAGVAPGEIHGCAWTTAGRVSCWGTNTSGEVGDGSGAQRRIPYALADFGTVVDLEAGSGTCARLSDGRVACWGRDGTTFGHDVPTVLWDL